MTVQIFGEYGRITYNKYIINSIFSITPHSYFILWFFCDIYINKYMCVCTNTYVKGKMSKYVHLLAIVSSKDFINIL